jgi:hypothetical protein
MSDSHEASAAKPVHLQILLETHTMLRTNVRRWLARRRLRQIRSYKDSLGLKVKLHLERLEERNLLSFTPIPQPVAAYTGATTNLAPSIPANGTSLTSLADATETINFSSSVIAGTVPTTFATWNSPPAVESSTPRVLIDGGATSLTLNLSHAARTFGFEAEPALFGLHNLTATFMDGAQVVGTISHSVEGDAGALLFAASTDQAFTSVVFTADAGAGGFALAQVRYALADLSVMESGLATVLAGNNVNYGVTLTNLGPDTAANVVLTANLSFNPAGGVFTPGTYTMTPAAGNPDSFTETVLPFGFIFTATGPIAAGNTDLFTVTGGILPTAPGGGTATVATNVTSTTADPDPTNNAASFTTIVTAPTTTTVSNASSTYNSTTAQTATLTAGVTSPGGLVNTGTVTFTVGSLSATVPVSAGMAITPLTVPAGFAAGSYVLNASYNDGVDFQGSSGSATFTVNSANSGTSVTDVATFFNGHVQFVTLTAHVTSSNGGTVNEGNVTFTVDGLPSVTTPVNAAGVATVDFALPAGFPAGTYTLSAVYNDVLNVNDTVNFISSAGSGSLIVRAGNGLVVNGLVEGMNSGLRAVAAITAPQDNNPANFTALINWGDGATPTLGLITFDPVSGNFTIFGSHTYADEGIYITTTTLLHNGAFDTTATGLAIVSDAAVVPGPGTTVSLPEADGTQSVTLAAFIDPGGAEALGDYSADIDWGDGSTTSGTITFNASTGVFIVSGTHAFADEGKFSVTVTIHHDVSPAVMVTDLLLATEADVLGDGPTTPVVTQEGAAFSGHVAVFTDTNLANVAGDFAATIDWGDGSPTDTGTVSGGNGLFTVNGNHTYAEENVYNLKVTLVDTDDDGSGLATAKHTVNSVAVVTEVPIVPVGGFTVTATEGTASTSQPVATFTDPAGAEALSSYSADIAWGDGSTTPGIITFAGNSGSGTFTVSGSHNYADEGQFSLTVTIHHEMAPPVVVNSTARVSEADVLASAPAQPTVAPIEGMSFSGAVAAFTDSGYPGNVAGDFTATIDWGDGMTTAGTVSGGGGQFSVNGTHTYTEEGSFTLSVTLTDKDDDGSGLASATATASATITVSDPAVDATGGLTVTPVEGNSSGNQTVATFTEPGGAEDVAHYSADVNWGDGMTTSGTITFDASTGVFSVQGSHTYAEEGTETISVTIHHEMATSVSVTSTANVADAALTAQGTSVTVQEGVAVNGTVATFTDANPGATLSDFTASIDWGDGSPTTAGTVTTNPSGGFDVTGNHTYAEDGHFTVAVSIHDVGGSTATASSNATVAEAAIVGTATSFTGLEKAPQSNVVVATFTHAGSEPASSFTATIDWGDGTSSAGTVVLSGSTYQVEGTHTYGDEKSVPYAVTVMVTDDATQPVTINSTAKIVEDLVLVDVATTHNQRFLSEVYDDLLGRKIDGQGLANWGGLLDQGVSRDQVVLDIENTTEYRMDQVEALYQRYFKRAADPTGLSGGVAFLENGGTVEQLAAALIDSPEYAQRAGSTDTQFFNTVYMDTFGRPIDQTGLNNILALRAQGASRASLVANILSSDEYRMDLVRSFYFQFLDRMGSQDELNNWSAFLAQGHRDEVAIADIMGSTEYFDKTVLSA